MCSGACGPEHSLCTGGTPIKGHKDTDIPGWDLRHGFVDNFGDCARNCRNGQFWDLHRTEQFISVAGCNAVTMLRGECYYKRITDRHARPFTELKGAESNWWP